MEEWRKETVHDGWKRGSGPRGGRAATRVMRNTDLAVVRREGWREGKRRRDREGAKRNVCRQE